MFPVEAVAYGLMRRHCGVLRQVLTSPSPYMDYPFLPGTLFLDQVPISRIDDDQTVGAQLRLALDVVNACCACEELHPVTNPGFWKRVEAELFSGDGEGSCLVYSEFEAPLFTEHSFACYMLIFFETSEDKYLAFWRSFFHVDESPLVARCQAALTGVLAKLRPYMGLPMRQLAITVVVDGQSLEGYSGRFDVLDVTTASSQQKILQALAQYANHPRCNVDLRLLGRHGVNSPTPMQLCDSWELAQALQTGPRVTIEYLELLIMKCGQSAEAVRSQIAPLGALLRVAFLHSNARSLKIAGSIAGDTSLVGAAFSIVPYAKGLAVVEDGCAFAGAPDRLLRLAWLVYATHHPYRSPRLSLQLTIYHEDARFNHNEMQYIEELLRVRMPLRDVVFDTLETRYKQGSAMHVDCFPFGSTVLVAAGTLVYCEPGRRSIEYAVAILAGDECVDVIALLRNEGSVGIVYPGYGLVWVGHSSVTWPVNGDSYEDAEDTKLHTSDVGASASLSSLSLRFGYYDTRAGVGNLQLLRLFLCPSLQRLELDGARIPHEAFKGIFKSCQHLQTLMLRTCSMDSLSPLVDAYTSNGGCCVSFLTISNVVVSEASFMTIFDALKQPTHSMTRTLRELHVDLSRLPIATEYTSLEQLVRALEVPRLRLRRVTVKLRTRSLWWSDAVCCRFKSLQGRPVSDLQPTIVVATLSVLRVRVAGCGGDVARLVLSFISGLVGLSVGCQHWKVF